MMKERTLRLLVEYCNLISHMHAWESLWIEKSASCVSLKMVSRKYSLIARFLALITLCSHLCA